jgi:uncharacterized protein
MIEPTTMAMIGAAALVAGAVNALAGGGSLITFPTLLAAGLPAIPASVINTVAMVPGYFGAAFAQRNDLEGQGRRAAKLLPASVLGGAAGALILLATSERVFELIVPFLLLFAALLIAISGKLRDWLLARVHHRHAESLAIVPVTLAAAYGGYFGAGMGVIVLGVLGVVLEDSLIRINALKQTISFAVNVAAAVVFLAWGPIDWTITLVMAVCSLAGGAFGGALSARLPQTPLRWVIVATGVVVAIVYLIRA